MNTPVASSLPRASVSESGIRSTDLRLTEKLITLLIFLYWLVYENVVFFYSMEYGGTAFFILTNGIKLFLPFGMLLYTGLPSYRILRRSYTSFYILFFVAFLLWGLVPTLVSGDPLAWLKLLPRLMFFLSVVAFFSRRPTAFSLFAKCMVVYVLSALLQYILLYWTGTYDNTIDYKNQRMAGPFGLLGNVTSIMVFPSDPFPIIRLTGFWNEPSNASGSAIAAFFLARYLVATGERSFWRWASYACLFAGILALSIAGYLALCASLVLGLFFGVRGFTVGRVFQFVLLLLIVIALFGLVVFGRSYVAENATDNIWARAITGARDHGPQQRDDVSSGRLDIAKMTLEKSASELIGVGIQEVGSEGIEGSATAPLYWLLLTGFPGLVLLLSRETVLLAATRSLVRGQPAVLPLTQALIAVMTQHLSYGSWMNPNYFILAAMVLVCSHKATQQLLTTSQLSHR